jgi:hypothetical protein
MTGVQDQHAPAVLANRLQLARHWDQPCLGYLLVGQPDAAAADALTAVQDTLVTIEPSLLCLPAAALHCTAAFLIPVFSECEPKDVIWRRDGHRWADVIATATLAHDGAICLQFRQLIMTDAAIIAVADQPNAISELRRALVPEPTEVSELLLVRETVFPMLEFTVVHRFRLGMLPPRLLRSGA